MCEDSYPKPHEREYPACHNNRLRSPLSTPVLGLSLGMENTANAQSGAGVKEGAKAVRPQRSSTLSTASSASARSLRDPFGRTREDSSVYEWRKRDFHAGQEVRQQEKKRRRESLASRGVVAAEHRRVSARLRDEERARESSLVESRRLDGDALLEHRAEARQQARESLAKRGAQWRVQRSAEERLRQEERARSESLSEWRRMDWQEHDRYRRALVADNQRSIAGLLERWRAAKGCSVHAEVRARKVQAMVGGRGVEREEAERMVPLLPSLLTSLHYLLTSLRE